MVRLGAVALRKDATRALGLAFLLAAGTAGGCTTNHDALARQPKAGSSAGGSAGASGFGSGAFNTGDQSQGGRINPDDEAMGDDVLTIVNAVVDAPSVRLCFARVGEDGQTQDFVGNPGAELAYATSTTLTALNGLSLIDDTIQPWVLSGELSRLDGLDCEAAVALAQSEEAKVTPANAALLGLGGAAGETGAGGSAAGEAATPGSGGAAGESGVPVTGPFEFPTLRARPLAALPPGTVAIGRSILMVLTGCSGGVAYNDTVETSVCGPAYTPTSPTLEPIIVKLSRVVGGGTVGLQAVHASQATRSLAVRASGDKGAVSLLFASSLSFGSIAPRPADTRYSPSELGVENFDYGLQAIDDKGGVSYQEAWSDILTAAGLPAIVAGRGYTAIFIGPDPLLLKEGWWNPSAFTLVDNDPTRK